MVVGGGRRTLKELREELKKGRGTQVNMRSKSATEGLSGE